MEWTREKTLQLINEYRKRRELWDMTHDDYRKKEMKHRYLTEVGESLGGNIPVIEIEKKFHTLRTQYHREINRMKTHKDSTYNSKWFAFRSLQFLSSPKACRSGKHLARIKSEITEDGTVTKYIISEQPDEVSPNSSASINDEFITIHRKPTTTITYETVSSGGGIGGSSSNTAPAIVSNTSVKRSRELEKLIEETTKDVEDINESKPKATLKEMHVPLEQNYNTHTDGADIIVDHHISQDNNHSQQSHHHHQQSIEEDMNPIESIDVQSGDEEIHYQPSTTAAHSIPTRYINSTPTTLNSKRIYYDANCHATTIVTNANTSAIPTNSIRVHSNGGAPQLSQSHPQIIRDECAIYGEYVASEMRNLTNREVLIVLKNRINTALFEANMAELQK